MRQETFSTQDRKRKLLLTGLIAVLLVLAFVIGRITVPESKEAVPPDGQAERVSVDEPTETNAVEAATSFARLMAGPRGDTRSYLEAAEEIAAPGWENRARELAQGSVNFITERYGPGAVLTFHPVRYRLNSYSSGEATVDIWGVVLASGPKLGGVEESWITTTLKLAWVDSEWKVSDHASKGGPTPELLRTEEEVSIDEVLDGFEEYER